MVYVTLGCMSLWPGNSGMNWDKPKTIQTKPRKWLMYRKKISHIFTEVQPFISLKSYFFHAKRWKLIQNLNFNLKILWLFLSTMFELSESEKWLKFGVWMVQSLSQTMSVKFKSYVCHNKPEPMHYKWQKGFFNLSSYKWEKGWPKCTPDPWTHCICMCQMSWWQMLSIYLREPWGACQSRQCM